MSSMKLNYYVKKLTLYIAVVCILLVSKLLIMTLPFKKIVELLSNSKGEPILGTDKRSLGRVKSLRFVIHKVAKRLPIAILCYEQAITALIILRMLKISSTIFFGINRNESNVLEAHAWSKAENIYITGFENMNEFTEVYKLSYEARD